MVNHQIEIKPLHMLVINLGPTCDQLATGGTRHTYNAYVPLPNTGPTHRKCAAAQETIFAQPPLTYLT